MPTTYQRANLQRQWICQLTSQNTTELVLLTWASPLLNVLNHFFTCTVSLIRCTLADTSFIVDCKEDNSECIVSDREPTSGIPFREPPESTTSNCTYDCKFQISPRIWNNWTSGTLRGSSYEGQWYFGFWPLPSHIGLPICIGPFHQNKSHMQTIQSDSALLTFRYVCST